MKKWIVYTPEYGVVIPITDDGQGPREYGCDAIDIEAETCRDAITFGVKEMLRGRASDGAHGRGMHYQWCRDQRLDHINPFSGVKAEPALFECSACEGTGNDRVHGLEGALCSACNGAGEVKAQP